MKNIIRFTFITLFLAACSLSPQVVQIDPILYDAKGSAGPGGAVFDLEVIDSRGNSILGKRGGVYKETALVQTEGDITGKIKQKLITAYNQAGFTIDPSASNRLIVSIVKLNYTGYGENRISEVEVGAEILATATRPSGKFSKSYKASRKKEVLKAPDNNKNEEMINEILGAVVQRVLDDDDLLDYLKQ